jgi:1-aminocyclopropane-1-carboxylate deaminase/D-cysteine desulfhydrase-like pyridoxal-dependent ACC family enzyme
VLGRRIDLICAPTPYHRLAKASEDLGIDLWIKRDDLTGFAGNGNKGRKLEFLIADVIDSGKKTVVTLGATQSNFVRQCAAACAMHSIDFHAVVMDWPYPDEPRMTRPEGWPDTSLPSGNLLLDKWLGAHIHRLPDGTFEDLDRAARELAERHGAYFIPGGGSCGVGALGFVAGAHELLSQDPTVDVVISASGSGGTQTGLTYAFAHMGGKQRYLGICTDDEPEMVNDFAAIAAEVDDLMGDPLRLTADDFDLRLDYCGKGYGVPAETASEAIRYLARTEGIFLDPVYTGKAFSGVIDLARRGELSGRVVFWHTGGFPGLFATGHGPSESN